jgi:lipopolysaccharide heptosyltransferase II
LLRAVGVALGSESARTVSAEAPPHPRVLLIRPDHLGDTVLSSPAVESLRKALPNAHLAMMLGPWSQEVARRDPLLDQVLACEFPGFARGPKSSLLAPYRLLWRRARDLRGSRFDAAVILRFDHWWGAALAALSGIPLRVGYGVAESAPFLSVAMSPPRRVHWAEQGLQLVAALCRAWGVPIPDPPLRPPLRFGLRAEEVEEAARLLAELGLGEHRPLVALHPGAGSDLKLWPEENWIRLGGELASLGARMVVTGSASEAPLARRIAASIPEGQTAAGRTNLGALAALFRRCQLVVGVDNGPLHLAVAVGARTVHLFGPTDPAVFGPWGEPSRHRIVPSSWPGSPCGRLDLRSFDGPSPPCMRAISVDQAAGACREVLSSEFWVSRADG